MGMINSEILMETRTKASRIPEIIRESELII